MDKKDTKQHMELSDPVNIGLKPANGLKPPRPAVAELEQEMKGMSPPLPPPAPVLILRSLA